MKLFVYEYATAQPESVSLPASVRREGRAMFEAVCADARKLGDVEILTVLPSEVEERRFRDVARRAEFALVIAPEFDGILETRCRWVETVGCRLLGPSSAAVRLTADKWTLFRHWTERGVPTPGTRLPSSRNAPSPPTPLPQGERGELAPSPPAPLPGGERGELLVKHRYGAGSLGVGWYASGPVADDHLLQEWVPGLPASLGVIVRADGSMLPLLPAQQCISPDGAFTYLGGRMPLTERQASRLIGLAARAVEGIDGLLGYVGIDAILGDAADGSQDFVLEINPRLTTSYVGLRQATSMNLLEVMLGAVCGEAVAPICWDRLPVEFTAAGLITRPSS